SFVAYQKRERGSRFIWLFRTYFLTHIFFFWSAFGVSLDTLVEVLPLH
ncbi:hypothetical protein AALP_AAs73510U000100, partial [Arabis alpina]